MITRLFIAAIAIAFGANVALAQQDFHKWEVSGGYSNARTEATFGAEVIPLPTGLTTIETCSAAGSAFFGPSLQRLFCGRRGFNGFDASVAFNFKRYLGIKTNISGHFKSDQFVDTTPPQTNNTRERLYNFLAGVQIKDNAEGRRVKPYAHALFGIAHYTLNDVQTSPIPSPFLNFSVSDSNNSFAMKLGGGIDLRVSKHLDLRLVEINYNPIFAGKRTLVGSPVPSTPPVANGRTAQNFTIGVGVAIH